MIAWAGGLACERGEQATGSDSAQTPSEESGVPEVDTEVMVLVDQASNIFGVLPDSVPPADYEITPAMIDLGRMLYYDKRLSKNHDVACNSCHQLDAYGVDGEPTSPGHRGQRGERNSPTVYNAALHIAQFWDGRAADVEEQAKGPVLNPVEMASASEESVVAVLKSIPGYAPAFAAAFPDEVDPITYDNMARAIGAFERQLMTPGPLDLFIAGDVEALDEDERQGLATFVSVGCVSCHMGPAVGGTLYRKLGFVFPYETEDPGREKITGEEADRHVFKVPSLRNVARTAPYFHDGSIATLEEAVRLMGYHQLGQTLEPAQIEDIVVFLNSLTGEIDEVYIAEPELPESGPDTPAPDPS
jgi:cytochrome c peroxidase